MQINITTIARRPQYLATTLKNLLGSDWKDQRCPVNIVLGSDDSSHVPKEYLADPTFTVVPWKMTSTGKPRQDCSLTHVSALQYGDGPTVILEDDVCFNQDWMASLLRTIKAIPREDYVLCLSQGRYKGVDLGGYSERASTSLLTGAQGIFYSTKAVREAVADHVMEKITRKCTDHLIGEIADQRFKLFLTGDVLIRHIGQCSCF